MENIIKKLSEDSPISPKPNKTKKKNTVSITPLDTPTIQESSPQENSSELLINATVDNILWFSVSESAKIGGVNTKTIRRAIQSKKIRYKVVKNRYFVDFSSVITYLTSNTKLKNKLLNYGIGQYIDSWKE